MVAADKPAPSRALGCFFLPFLGLGLFFAGMIVRDAIAAAATYSWQSASCRILESSVRETLDRSPWFGYVRYASPVGESVRSSREFGSYRDALRFTRRFPAGSAAACFLDPQDSAGALLERKSAPLVLLLFLPLPLLFVLIGAAGFCSVVFRVQFKPRVPRRANPAAGRRVAAALLIAAGTLVALFFLLGPVRHALAARSWQPRSCTIIRSQVRRFHNSKGRDSFAPLIFYSYMVDGAEHRADVANFFDTAGGWNSANRFVGQYRPGSTTTCYVNPADPDEATLNRNPTAAWLIGLLPLALLYAGLRLWPRSDSLARSFSAGG